MSVNSLPSSTVAVQTHPQPMTGPGMPVTVPRPARLTMSVRDAALVATGGKVNALRNAPADGRSVKSLRRIPKW